MGSPTSQGHYSKEIAILSSHLSTLLEARSVSPNELDPLVEFAIQGTKDGRTKATRSAQWEYVLKNEVLQLAATEGEALKQPDSTYFDELKARLDLVLAFTEHDVTDSVFPFSVLEDLLETQTVESCAHIFSWIEERQDRLTINLVPGKGKALLLLRTLNDLLRRLSKTGNNTMLCGRILNFLSSAFPLGERSGVNLRGDYGPQWEEVKSRREQSETEDGDKMEEDKKVEKTEDEKKDDLYQTFWWLQLPFSRPPLFAHTISFDTFRKAVNTVLPIISEATKKERAMMGSKTVNLKRKRETDVSDSSKDFFSAKFLTSPELLDYEIADTNFRRQILFQLLILLQHLLRFTPAEKAKWVLPRNRSLQMEFTLNDVEAKWAKEMWTKAMDELRATAPNGKVVADTVGIILERENNWIRWKNDLCPPFDKDPLQPSVEEGTSEKRQKMMEPQPVYRHACGSQALTDVWETGFNGLRDCEMVTPVQDVKDFARSIKNIEARIALRKRQLERMQPQPQVEKPARPNGSQTDSAPAISPPAAASPPPVIAVPAVVAPAPTLPPPNSLHPSLPPRPNLSPAPNARGTNGRPASAAPPAAPAPAPAPVDVETPPPPKPVVPPTPKADERIAEFTEQRNKIAWLALRRARTEYLHLFDGKTGVGDIEGLAAAIEVDKEKEKIAASGGSAMDTDQPATSNTSAPQENPSLTLSTADSTQVEGKSAEDSGEDKQGNSQTATTVSSESQKTEESAKMEVDP